jgi:fumarylpyruvate hydrolase
MTAYVTAVPPQIAVPVQGGGLFAVRRVYCVGRNYAAHAREMGGDPQREPPVFFTKPADALVTAGADTPYPPATESLHHEVELVVAIGQGGADIAAASALTHVFGYAVGLDLTRRDVQERAKAARQPWDMAKGFDASGPIGVIAPAGVIGHLAAGRIALQVNGVARQIGELGDMIWPVAEIIAALSRLVRLAPGDLIFTGTPDGVGPLARGDVLRGEVSGVGVVETRIL